ncbi:hypothetical protein J4232_04205 [Candidatus Woesearchaeota archaeon]|nr:hypothetical protein [Candidatus Woesearchaeota archaeon]
MLKQNLLKIKSNKKAAFWLRFFIMFTVLIILSYGIITFFDIITEQDSTADLITESYIKETQKQITPVFDNGSIDVYFCQTQNCAEKAVELINAAKQTISCALYDLDNQEILLALQKKAQQNVFVRVVVDNDNKGELQGNVFRFDNNNQLMHNKFCVFDNSSLFTGSMNPTDNDIYKNDNNFVVINSSKIAENYNDEFKELWNEEFGNGKEVRYPKIVLNINVSDDSINILSNQQNHSLQNQQIEIENYFCPEDKCEQQVIEILKTAKKSIYFMVFSFTSDNIGNILMEKAKQGIVIDGVFDTSQNNQFTEYLRLKDANISVIFDNNKYKLHHKVFIVDETVVITGSYNPTKNGNENNDENVIIIHDAEIAAKYLQEFERIKVVTK